ncbi:MAG TPA: response regulator [Blastocatellia bacterium]|nr:response regulator [Blastocatellia bacterium]
MPARILVIEDDPDLLRLISYLFTSFGYTTLTADDGEEGLEMARHNRPDLILCDLQLPKLDAYEAASRLKSDPNLSRTKLVAVTALALVGDRDRMAAAGFDGYITKPINARTFVKEAERFLASHQVAVRQALESEFVGQESAVAPKRAKILVVDDILVNRTLARNVLGSAGYEVVTASGGAEALNLVHSLMPDLIMTDLSMDRGNGDQLIVAVRADQRLRHIPIIVLTATFTEEPDRERCLALGADRFLIRPIAANTLLNEVKGCCQEQRNRS